MNCSQWASTWSSSGARTGWAKANAYADALLERFEMADKRDKLGKELSKGMQQKLVICALPGPKW